MITHLYAHPTNIINELGGFFYSYNSYINNYDKHTDKYIFSFIIPIDTFRSCVHERCTIHNKYTSLYCVHKIHMYNIAVIKRYP